MRPALPALAVLVAFAAGCRRAPPPPSPLPVENALVVSSDVAPGLPEAEDDEPASMVLRKGAVLLGRRRFGTMRWHGEVLGEKLTRDAAMVEAQLTPAGTFVYVFASDVTEASVPATLHFCASAPKNVRFVAPCAGVLRRYVLGADEAVAYDPCGALGCGVAHAKGTSVTWASVDGLSALYPATLGARRVLIATTHFQRSLAETGRRVKVLAVEPGLPVLGELLLDEIDSRSQTVVSRSGDLVIRGDTLELSGVRREVDKVSGKELGTAPIKELWGLGADGKLARR